MVLIEGFRWDKIAAELCACRGGLEVVVRKYSVAKYKLFPEGSALGRPSSDTPARNATIIFPPRVNLPVRFPWSGDRDLEKSLVRQAT
jgi:hypothetical protein